jgi:hypothetical protein
MGENRRLSDKIIEAHALACADGKLEVADCLIRALEAEISGIGQPTERRRATAQMELSFERHHLAKTAS